MFSKAHHTIPFAKHVQVHLHFRPWGQKLRAREDVDFLIDWTETYESIEQILRIELKIRPE
jgi:hypothetical protein